MKSHTRIITYAVFFASFAWLVASCKAVPPLIDKPSETPSPSQTATVTVIPTPTVTPTPQAPVAVLLASPGADQALVERLQTSLNDSITGRGLRWQVRQTLSVNDLTAPLQLVLVVPPDPGLSALVSALPDTQFLALDIPNLQPAPNLTLMDASASHPDQQGFISGVIAAMLAPDWRVGVISLSDTVAGRSARTGFLNGVEFFCGLCRPLHPPYYEYPLYIELPSTASAPEWQEAANYMVDHFVQAVYVFAGAGDENMLSILAGAKVSIISAGEPPQDNAPSWALSLETDPFQLIQSQVEGLLDGSLSGGQTLSVPMHFTHINSSLFTPGKQRLAGDILSDLQNGSIDTGVDLTTGENRP